MKRTLLMIVTVTGIGLGQQQHLGSKTSVGGNIDRSGAAHTLPVKVGTIAGKPGTCTIGELYFATDASAGSNFYYCTATNTWTAQSGGGGGVGGFVMGTFSPSAAGVASGTNYFAAVGSTTTTASMSSRFMTIPASCTARNGYVQTSTAQPAGGSLVFTLYRDVAGTPTATALQITINANGAAGIYSDTTHTVSLSAGDVVAWQVVNNHSTTSAVVRGFSFQCN